MRVCGLFGAKTGKRFHRGCPKGSAPPKEAKAEFPPDSSGRELRFSICEKFLYFSFLVFQFLFQVDDFLFIDIIRGSSKAENSPSNSVLSSSRWCTFRSPTAPMKFSKSRGMVNPTLAAFSLIRRTWYAILSLLREDSTRNPRFFQTYCEIWFIFSFSKNIYYLCCNSRHKWYTGFRLHILGSL